MNQLEALIESSFPSGQWIRMDQLEYSRKVIAGHLKWGDIDFILWDSSNRELVLIEAKQYKDPRDGSPTDSTDLLEKLYKKMITAMFLVHHNQTQSELWATEFRDRSTIGIDNDWLWRLIFIVDVVEKDVQGLATAADNLKKRFKYLQQFCDVHSSVKFRDDKLFVITPALAKTNFPHLFPNLA